MRFVEEKIADICSLSSNPIIMPEVELGERFAMDYGSVNPMMFAMNSSDCVINLFDTSVTQQVAICPGTMMTNACDHTWGIEFDPRLLIKKISPKIIGHIAVSDKGLISNYIPQWINPKSIGIITGNGPDSGIALWNMINAKCVELLNKNFLGDISLPEIRIVSLPAMGVSVEFDKRNTATMNAVMKSTGLLKNVDILALTCITNHYFTKTISELSERNGCGYMSIMEAVIKYIMHSKLNNFALLGNNFITDLASYKEYAELKNLNCEHISEHCIEMFRKLACQVKEKQNLRSAFQKLIHLLNTHIESENIILALTELSLLFRSFKNQKFCTRNVIDPLEIYAEKLSYTCLGFPDPFFSNSEKETYL